MAQPIRFEQLPEFQFADSLLQPPGKTASLLDVRIVVDPLQNGTIDEHNPIGLLQAPNQLMNRSNKQIAFSTGYIVVFSSLVGILGCVTSDDLCRDASSAKARKAESC